MMHLCIMLYTYWTHLSNFTTTLVMIQNMALVVAAVMMMVKVVNSIRGGYVDEDTKKTKTMIN